MPRRRAPAQLPPKLPGIFSPGEEPLSQGEIDCGRDQRLLSPCTLLSKPTCARMLAGRLGSASLLMKGAHTLLPCPGTGPGRAEQWVTGGKGELLLLFV